MTLRKLFLFIAMFVLNTVSALAAGPLPYEQKAFQSALEASGPVLVHVTAPWCGECKAQKPIVSALAKTAPFSEFTIFEVDYDTQKEVLRHVKAQKQSTLIVFKGKAEVARAVGITRREAIEALLRKGL